MNKFMWVLGATCLGVAAYVLLSDASANRRTADGLDDLSDEVSDWGTKNRVKGTGGVLGGKLKQGFGKLTGDDELQGEGAVDEGVGRVKDVAGQAAHAVSDAVAGFKE